MAGSAVHFATIHGICHFIAEGVSGLKPEWNLDAHSISAACAGLAGVSLAGAHAAAQTVGSEAEVVEDLAGNRSCQPLSRHQR